MLSDIEISQRAELEPIEKIAEKIGLTADDIELYGKYAYAFFSMFFRL